MTLRTGSVSSYQLTEKHEVKTEMCHWNHRHSSY